MQKSVHKCNFVTFYGLGGEYTSVYSIDLKSHKTDKSRPIKYFLMKKINSIFKSIFKLGSGFSFLVQINGRTESNTISRIISV